MKLHSELDSSSYFGPEVLLYAENFNSNCALSGSENAGHCLKSVGHKTSLALEPVTKPLSGARGIVIIPAVTVDSQTQKGPAKTGPYKLTL